MKNYSLLIVVAFLSSLFTVLLYRYLGGGATQVVWASEPAGEVRYTGLFDQILDHGARLAFRGSSPTDFTEAARIATPGVVNIRALLSSNGLWGGTLTGSSGSGVIISPDGYIVTNHHVVERSADIKVTLADKREYKAKLIGSDPSTDIALLKIDVRGLPFLLFGNSDSVRVGEWALAVGNPFNLESTVTAGIISAKGRNLNILSGGASIESFLQTDAAVNPGNSGGALVNTAGELIGINTAIITESGSYEGYSFAVPSNLVQKVIRDLREYGIVQRAFLGVGIQDLDSETAQQIGIPTVEGVFITRVNSNSGAADAGLQSGDVILGVNETRVRRMPELLEFVGRYRPGDQLTLEYWRSGKKYRTRVTLKDGNNASLLARVRGDELEDVLGLELRNLRRDEMRRLQLEGALVTSVTRGSIIDDTNMKPGFVIIRVNGRNVGNIEEAIGAIQNAYGQVELDGYYEGEPDMYSYRFRKLD